MENIMFFHLICYWACKHASHFVGEKMQPEAGMLKIVEARNINGESLGFLVS